ncbi:epimerase [Erythrobacter sp. SG61-1L]|uniref:epimerase n=1 Tax=Erythrobacter sp. SG61-1L TaxID=1603897 RepID=UPI0006C91600|nr:epimerase [Erythrobacter sp. SG61-1L]KPL68998.1 epimerase [Erythrobacter sp. SG61-1L]
MAHFLIFGLGYTAGYIASDLRAQGWQVDATGSRGNIAFDDEQAVHDALDLASHVISSVPPDPATGLDPVLERYGAALAGRWLGYLSSTGVYGDTGGAWIDEDAPTGGGRRTARAAIDARWLELGAHVFRLPGIYGPGRSALDRVREGKARRIDVPGQVFSRVHVADIASGVVKAVNAPAGAYNLADDYPCSQNEVIEEACRLLGSPLPPLVALEDAGLSDQALAFYTENRRISNGKAKRILGWKPTYPTYREGLRALNASTMPSNASTAPATESSDQR